MDKKNTFLGLLFIASGIGYMFWQSVELQKQERLTAQEAAKLSKQSEVDKSSTSPNSVLATASESAAEESAILDLLAKDVSGITKEPELLDVSDTEEIVTISNDYIRVEFTNLGGAIRRVEFLKTKRG